MKKILKALNNSDLLGLLLVTLMSLGSVYFLLLPGFYEPQDLHHIADIYQMYRAIISGQIPPRWGPDFLFGFGYPLFNFYYVGPFYLGALFYFLSGSLTTSYEMVFIVSVIIGTAGFYLFLRQHFSKMASFAASVLFTFTPYKAVQIYVRGAMGELLALSLMPWLMYFSGKYLKEKKRKWLFLSVLVSAFIILSHNYFWILIFGFYGLYLVLISANTKKYHIFGFFVTEVFLALGLTAYWWLPALVEQKLLDSSTPFPLIDHFPFIKQLLIPFWGYGASLWGPGDGMSFQIGLVNVLVVVVSIFVFLKAKKEKRSAMFIWSFVGFLLCVFFMNVRSYFIWKVVPFHNLFQFPWRLLSFTTLFSSVLTAFIIDNLPSLRSRILPKVAAIFVVLLGIGLTFSYFRPSKIFYKKDDAYLNRMFANRTTEGVKDTVSPEYVNYSEDYLLLPKWLNKKPNFLPKDKFASSDTDAISINAIRELNPVDWEADVTVKTSGRLNFYSLYFPGWKVAVDGNETSFGMGDAGEIVLDLKEGDNLVHVFWEETTLRKITDRIPVVSFILLIFLVTISKTPHVGKNNKKG